MRFGAIGVNLTARKAIGRRLEAAMAGSSFFNTTTFGDIMIRQSQNTARLAFEVQFQAVKRRLNIELNQKKEEYNNMDKTLEPVLAGLKAEKAKLLEEQKKYTDYLTASRDNLKKVQNIIDGFIPKLADAASSAAPTAEADFNQLRDKVNNALRSLKPVTLYEKGLQDRTKGVRAAANPSGIGDYASYGSIPARADAVGILLSGGLDGTEVITSLSKGFAEKLGLMRYDMQQDFNFVNGMLGKTEQAYDKNGKALLDEKGKPVMNPVSGVYLKIGNIDKQIEKKDAQERLVVLRQVQTMERRNDSVLQSLSLNFEFSQANSEVLADRFSWNKAQKGSIMNLFI